ncbi:hypothetical protein SAMN03159343_0599 [Klenkia marina]|uniref:Neocarzinostatin family protein n=1 Tax=Klenkia marina TaxID=1960309 RepID=A0A1G4XDB1_9ACTN|nr:hypothetical protein [Klenkia marina]SCX39141.1 hypothetical protein SAMN03159343_0599 [Klenkia marina]
MTTAAHLRRRAGMVTALVGALVVVGAGPALADSSQASATAVGLSTNGNPTASSGTVAASNDGQTPVTTGDPQPALTVLGSQTLITSGTLVQRAVARADGTSAACSGLVGSGGSITIGADGSCTVVNGSGGVSIRLLGGGLPVDIRADAITSRCTASSSGATTAAAALVNARVVVSTALGPTTIPLAAAPAVGAGVSVPGVATLVLNGQTAPQGAGSVRAGALTVNLLTGGVRVDVATSSCGLNVVTLPVPAVPISGWTALAAAVVAGWGVLAARWVRARRPAAGWAA